MSSGAVALTTADDRVVVVKASYKRYWSFPGGIIDEGETPRQAAAREVWEEVGIRIESEDLAFRLVANRVSDIAQTYQFVFEAMASDEDFAAIRLDEREITEFAVVTRQQIIDSDRNYSQSVRLWAEGVMGYDEQIFGAGRTSEI